MRPQAKIRLNRYLALAGLGSRRGVEAAIRKGEVAVNGTRVREPGTLVSPASDVVTCRGNPVHAALEPTYVVLNKPRGFITTVKDERKRPTVFQLVRCAVRIVPVGRLDRDSEGLLLLTNDGDLAYRLTHPRYKVEKAYRVVLNRRAPEDTESQFRKGVTLGREGRAHAVVTFPDKKNRKFCRVVLKEGRNRQIRRMFAKIGCRVTALQRVRIGPLELGRLQSGAWRYLTSQEISALYSSVGYTDGNQE